MVHTQQTNYSTQAQDTAVGNVTVNSTEQTADCK